jgi:hypothetical protein
MRFVICACTACVVSIAPISVRKLNKFNETSEPKTEMKEWIRPIGLLVNRQGFNYELVVLNGVNAFLFSTI